MAERFYKLPQELSGRPDVTASAKILYAVIRDRIGDNGKCWAGVRRLARDCGINVKTVGDGVAQLEADGLLIVEHRQYGQSNLYRIPESAPKTGTVQAIGETGKRPEKRNTGAPKTGTEAHRKPVHNQTDPLNQRGAATPPDGESFALTPTTTPLTPSTPGTGALVGLWFSLFHKKTGRDFPATGKGQLACTIKRLSASFSADDLDGAIRSWFTQDRRDYGVGLFKMKLEGGDRELLKRGQTFQDDPQALRNGVALAAMAEKSK